MQQAERHENPLGALTTGATCHSVTFMTRRPFRLQRGDDMDPLPPPRPVIVFGAEGSRSYRRFESTAAFYAYLVKSTLVAAGTLWVIFKTDLIALAAVLTPW